MLQRGYRSVTSQNAFFQHLQHARTLRQSSLRRRRTHDRPLHHAEVSAFTLYQV